MWGQEVVFKLSVSVEVFLRTDKAMIDSILIYLNGNGLTGSSPIRIFLSYFLIITLKFFPTLKKPSENGQNIL